MKSRQVRSEHASVAEDTNEHRRMGRPFVVLTNDDAVDEFHSGSEWREED